MRTRGGVRRGLGAVLTAAFVCLLGLVVAAGRVPAAAAVRSAASGASLADSEWPAYGNDAGGTRFSSLDEINATNVAELEVAWTYQAGESREELDRKRAVGEATPLLLDGRLIYATPLGQVVALDGATGTELWKVRAESERLGGVTRGVSAWRDPLADPAALCATRIYYPSPAARLYALDAATGRPCLDFGDDGRVEIGSGFRVRNRSAFRVTSPPAVVGEVVVVGSAIADNEAVRETRGFVQGFDARSGRRLWKWDPVRPASEESPAPPGEGARKVRTGAANAWSILSADPERDLVFVPTGSASPDHFGGKRPGDNRHANSVVALRASSGEVVWHFQVVHHDLWDYDVATQPSAILYRASVDEPATPAVVVGSKAGHVFVLDRTTGEALIPVSEVAVPGDGARGETLSPTQPIPDRPLSLVAGTLSPETVFGLDEEDRAWCAERVRGLRDDGLYTPPSVEGTLMYPAETGGINWGGLSWHPERELLIANTSRIAGALWLVRGRDFDPDDVGVWQAENPTTTVGLQRGVPFVMRRELLMTPEGVPCNQPPWGQLAAINLREGTIEWQVPLGVTPAVEGRPKARSWGSRNAGGALVTAGDVVFIAATLDDTIRAFDVGDGTLLWEAELPAGGQATPMTYSAGGRQYVVIVAGGHWTLGTTLGDYVVAFALP